MFDTYWSEVDQERWLKLVRARPMMVIEFIGGGGVVHVKLNKNIVHCWFFVNKCKIYFSVPNIISKS